MSIDRKGLLCERGTCRKPAKWLPMLLLQPTLDHPQGEPAQLLAGVVICSECRLRMTPNEFFSEHQRKQIETVFDVASQPKPDWSRARFEWLDLQSEEIPEQVLVPIAEKQRPPM